ncbi:MAG: glycosyltransferase family 87 protein [Promethearchaeota archaeon]
MNLPNKFIRRFKELWEYKVFRYTLVVQIFYFILAIVLFFVYYHEKNDFLIFYNVGDIFLHDIEHLYDQTNYLWDFRYFPLSALFFIPYSFLNYELAFIIFNLFNIVLNVLICIILYKIIIRVRGFDHEEDDKRILKYLCLYCMCFPNLLNFILGQINLYITLFILVSLFIFLKYNEIKWQFIGSLILGISIIIKPTTIFLIPFLIIINFNREERKLKIDLSRSVIRIIGIITPVLMNIIFFLSYPNLWNGFLATNFTGTNPVALNFSFSITKLVINFCYFYNIPFNQLVILIVVMVIFGGLGFVIFVFRKNDENSIIYGYAYGLIIMLLVYYDSWYHHLLNLIPVLVIIIFNSPRHSKVSIITSRSVLFFHFFDLIFVGVWYLVYPLFPYNFGSTVFLLLTFYGISKYCLKEKTYKINIGNNYFGEIKKDE